MPGGQAEGGVPGAAGDRGGSAVGGDDGVNHGETQTGAPSAAGAGMVGADERPKTSAWSSSGCLAYVAHVRRDSGRLNGEGDRHYGAGRGMDTGIGGDVADGLLEPVGFSSDGDWFFGEFEEPAVAWAGGACVVRRIQDQQGQIDRLVVEGASSVQAGKEKQVVHEAAHMLRFAANAFQGTCSTAPRRPCPSPARRGPRATAGRPVQPCRPLPARPRRHWSRRGQ